MVRRSAPELGRSADHIGAKLHSDAQAEPQTREATGILVPLRHPLFLALLTTAFASNIEIWMQEVGASWLMTSIAPSPVMVSLIQTAANLPYFLMGLIAGALADIADRRRLLIIAQVLMLASAGTLGVSTLLHLTTPWILLGLSFSVGIGAAQRTGMACHRAGAGRAFRDSLGDHSEQRPTQRGARHRTRGGRNGHHGLGSGCSVSLQCVVVRRQRRHAPVVAARAPQEHASSRARLRRDSCRRALHQVYAGNALGRDPRVHFCYRRQRDVGDAAAGRARRASSRRDPLRHSGNLFRHRRRARWWRALEGAAEAIERCARDQRRDPLRGSKRGHCLDARYSRDVVGAVRRWRGVGLNDHDVPQLRSARTCVMGAGPGAFRCTYSPCRAVSR